MKAQLDRLRAQVAAFLWWWGSELAALVPARWRARMQAGRRQLIVTLHDDHINLEHHYRGEATLHRANGSLAALDESDWNDLAALASEARTSVALAPAQQFGLYITLPNGALGRIDDAISYQLARHSPVDPSALVWSRHIAERQHGSSRIAINLARRSDAEAVQALFDSRGLARPTIISSARGAPQTLLRGEDGSHTNTVRSNCNAAWLALALIASIPLTSLALLKSKRQSVEDQLLVLSSDANSAARASAKLQAATDSARALQALVRSSSAATQLARSAAALPDGAILTGYVQKRGAPVQLRLTLPAGMDPAQTGLAITDARPLPDGRTALIVEAAP